MTRDLRNARLCIHELVFRNVSLENHLSSLTSGLSTGQESTLPSTAPSTVELSGGALELLGDHNAPDEGGNFTKLKDGLFRI